MRRRRERAANTAAGRAARPARAAPPPPGPSPAITSCASGTAASTARHRVEQHVDAASRAAACSPRRRPGPARRDLRRDGDLRHGGQPLWTTSSAPAARVSRASSRSNSHTQMIASVNGASARSATRPKRRRASRHLAHEREPVRRVDHRLAREPRRDPPDHARLGGVRVHEVERAAARARAARAPARRRAGARSRAGTAASRTAPELVLELRRDEQRRLVARARGSPRARCATCSAAPPSGGSHTRATRARPHSRGSPLGYAAAERCGRRKRDARAFGALEAGAHAVRPGDGGLDRRRERAVAPDAGGDLPHGLPPAAGLALDDDHDRAPRGAADAAGDLDLACRRARPSPSASCSTTGWAASASPGTGAGATGSTRRRRSPSAAAARPRRRAGARCPCPGRASPKRARRRRGPCSRRRA